MTKKAFLTAVAVLTLVGAASWSGLFAENSAPPAPSFAVVDLDKAIDNYTETAKAQQELAAFDQASMKKGKDRDDSRFLSDDERKEYESLLAVASPNDAQKKRLAELVQLNNARNQQYRGLQMNPSRTPKEEEDYKLLDARNTQTEKDLEELSNKLQEERNKKVEEISNRLDQAVQQAVAKVAAQKGVPAVFLKKAVLYGGLDITDDVVKELNSKK
jgi:Skp family chaperone for outer membrane proteins